MLCGVLQPGKPVANLYFSMFSHEVTVLSVFLSTDLKMAQYLKIPWRTLFLLQTYGSLFGTALNYVSPVLEWLQTKLASQADRPRSL